MSLKPEFYGAVASLWRDNRDELATLVAQHFGVADTRYDLFRESHGKTDHIRNHTPQAPDSTVIDSIVADLVAKLPRPSGIGFHLDHAVVREGDPMPASTAVWFDNVVRCLAEFDRALSEELGE